jgi:hypothetical protein
MADKPRSELLILSRLPLLQVPRAGWSVTSLMIEQTINTAGKASMLPSRSRLTFWSSLEVSDFRASRYKRYKVDHA